MQKNTRKNIFQKFIGLCLCLGILSGGISIFGQGGKARTVKAASPVKSSNGQCNGGWSGIVTFRKTLNDIQ